VRCHTVRPARTGLSRRDEVKTASPAAAHGHKVDYNLVASALPIYVCTCYVWMDGCVVKLHIAFPIIFHHFIFELRGTFPRPFLIRGTLSNQFGQDPQKDKISPPDNTSSRYFFRTGTPLPPWPHYYNDLSILSPTSFRAAVLPLKYPYHSVYLLHIPTWIG
jgi:hypothetical protein